MAVDSVNDAADNDRRHNWTHDDDTLVVGLYLLSGRTPNHPAEVKSELADLIGCPAASVTLRLGNVDAYLGSGKLSPGAKQTMAVCDELSQLSLVEVRTRVEAARARLNGQRDQPQDPGGTEPGDTEKGPWWKRAWRVVWRTFEALATTPS